MKIHSHTLCTPTLPPPLPTPAPGYPPLSPPDQVNLNSVVDSFAACIGSVTDIVAQGVQLRISPLGGCTLQSLSGCAYDWKMDGADIVVTLGEVCGTGLRASAVAFVASVSGGWGRWDAGCRVQGGWVGGSVTEGERGSGTAPRMAAS